MFSDDADDGHILLLDDDVIVTRSLAALLKLETSWRVTSCNRVAEAIDVVGAQDFDVIVSDFLMPELDGVEFLKRSRELRPFASRILLTGYADKQNAIRSINEVGLYQYLEKPWDNDAILLVLRNALERARLYRRLDDLLRRESERDRSLEALRARLLKAMV